VLGTLASATSLSFRIWKDAEMLCVETPKEHQLVGYVAREDVIERVLHACDGAWPGASAMFPETGLCK
jgi:hypothetical protein